MLKQLACYTCVFVCTIGNTPCSGDSLAGPSDAQPVTTAAPDPNSGRESMPVLGSAEMIQRSSKILGMARETNEDVYNSLLSFVCSEQIERFKGPLSTETAKQIDSVTATVSFENGTEHYSDIRQNTKARPSMASLSGAWSEGEFGTLLRQTQLLLSTQMPSFDTFATLDGAPAAIYQMDVSEDESPWDLEVRNQHYRLPFRTKIWVSEASGEILKIERISTHIPFRVGISEIRWNVVLKDVDLNGKTWLLPSIGEYAVLYQESSHREWNVMHFSDYHRYGSEVAIKFQ
ncbi:MAG TPA: hypothetical protein VFA65_09290 [Bryobacteraceae bacterium]|nr:hypothetical protein [Bryobacteraceae bacterium]